MWRWYLKTDNGLGLVFDTMIGRMTNIGKWAMVRQGKYRREEKVKSGGDIMRKRIEREWYTTRGCNC